MNIHLLSCLFPRRLPETGSRAKRARRRQPAQTVEQLERRLALTADVTIFEVPRSERGEGWASVLIERGSSNVDIAITQESVIGGDVAIDLLDGSGKRYIEGFSNKFDVLSVFEGAAQSVENVRWADFPFTDSSKTAIYFPLPIEYLDEESEITGVLAVGGRSLNFSGRIADGHFEFIDTQASASLGRISVELVYTPVSGSFGGGGTAGGTGGTGTGTGTGTGVGSVVSEFAGIVFRDADLAGKLQIDAGATQSDVRITAIELDPFINSDSFRRVFNDVRPSRSITVTGRTELQFQLFDVAGLTYAPGTLAGRLEVQFPATGLNELLFYADTLVPDQENFVRVAFAAANQEDAEPTPEFVVEGNILDDDTSIDPGNTSYLLEGFLSLETGVLHLVSDSVYSSSFGFSRTAGGAAIAGRVLDATAGFSLPIDDPQRLIGSVDVRVAPGGDFLGGLNVNLSAEDSTVWVQNPIVASAGTASSGTVSFGATSVIVDAAIRAADAFVVSNVDREGLVVRAAANPENVEVNARISSPRFRFDVSVDSGDERSQLLVGQGGVLYNANSWIDVSEGVIPAAWADEVVVNIDSGDVFLAGTAAATLHNVNSTSNASRPLGAGFEISTRSPVSAIGVGRMIGQTAVFNLGNDTLGPLFNSLVESVVSVDTEIETLRVAAASRPGDPLDEPFPYAISVREKDDLVVDAMARSSGAIGFNVGGTLALRAALRSQDDVSVQSGGRFAVAAPVTTSFGKIVLTAPEIVVDDKVQILDRRQDERMVDIELVATSGDLELNDAVIGINRVVLKAAGDASSIIGKSTVFADLVEASADGDISLRTEANVVAAHARGTVSLAEESAAVFEVSRSEDVSITVAGTDTLLDSGVLQAVSPALYADVYGALKLHVSAPNGSVDVLHHDSDELTVGEVGGAVSAVAAGSVVIASDTAATINVVEAPFAASSAIEVRTATTAPLDATYTPGTPGVFRTYLDTIVQYDGSGKISGFGGLEVDGLRVGDRVLVKDGMASGSNLVNGVYAVVRKQFLSSKRVELRLARVLGLDETTEWEGRRYIRVTDGELRGRVFVTNGFENREPGASDPTPVVVRSVLSRSGYVVARATTTKALGSQAVSYEVNEDGIEEIKAKANGNIAFDSNLFNQVVVGQGDLVLVRDGVLDGVGKLFTQSPGVYQVIDAGNADKPWVFRRYTPGPESRIGGDEQAVVGLVAVNEGSLRTSKTGQMFEVMYDSMHHADLEVSEVQNFRDQVDFSNPSSTPFNSDAQYRTEIGSLLPNGLVRYTVTSEAGTNTSPGSLGKMLTLAQNNTAKDGRVERRQTFDAKQQAFEIVVHSAVKRIELQQALPAIRSTIALNGRNTTGERIVIDGTQVTTSRDGAVIRTSLLLNDMGPLRPSQFKTARKLVRDVSQGSRTEAYGFEFISGSDGSVISGFAIGGFRTGGGIRVAGADSILIDDVILGEDLDGSLLANDYGVIVQSPAATNGSPAKTGFGTTVLSTEISGSVSAAVRFDQNTNGARVVDSHIHDNSVGIEVDSVTGRHLIGSAAILPAQPIIGLRLTKVEASSEGLLRVSVRQSPFQRNEVVDFLRTGHQFYDSVTGAMWMIKEKMLDSTNAGQYIFTLDVGETAIAAVGEEVSVQAGYFVQAVARSEELVLPAGMIAHRDDLFLGQQVRAAASGVLANGTRIKSIVFNPDKTTTIGLTEPVLATTTVGVMFGATPGGSALRNRIEANDDGIVLESASSRVVGTDISRSTYDGIFVVGVAAQGRHEIGGVNVDSQPVANNAIYSNGYAGIRVAEEFFEQLGQPEEGRITAVRERLGFGGNFFGTDSDARSGYPNGADGNIFFTDPAVQQALVLDANADYRPNLETEDPRLKDRDSHDNFHFSGEPASVQPGTGFGGGDDDDWMIDPPIRR